MICIALKEEKVALRVCLKRSYQMRDIANFARMEGRKKGKQDGMMEKSKQLAFKLLMRNELIVRCYVSNGTFQRASKGVGKSTSKILKIAEIKRIQHEIIQVIK